MLLKKPKFKMPKLLQGSGEKTRVLNQTELDRLALELDAIRAETLADLNEKDAKYILKIVSSMRYSAITGDDVSVGRWYSRT